MDTYKMYFNTGVTPNQSPPILLSEHQEWRNGTLQIAFYLERQPPEGATLRWLCDHPDKKDGLAIKVVGGGMLSNFAVFHIPENKENNATVRSS